MVQAHFLCLPLPCLLLNPVIHPVADLLCHRAAVAVHPAQVQVQRKVVAARPVQYLHINHPVLQFIGLSHHPAQ
ncbi:hypothetical protein KWE67_15255 [Acinetobacter baumannii]